MFGDKRRPPATIAAEIDRIIGLNIRRAREDVRLGQHEVATLLELSVHLLARYEEGQERAPAAVLLDLTRHLGCSLTDLFAGMPALEVDAAFQGSKISDLPLPPFTPRPSSTPESPPPAPTTVSAHDDALAVAKIVQGFVELTNPVLRERLLGLLQALA